MQIKHKLSSLAAIIALVGAVSAANASPQVKVSAGRTESGPAMELVRSGQVTVDPEFSAVADVVRQQGTWKVTGVELSKGQGFKVTAKAGADVISIPVAAQMQPHLKLKEGDEISATLRQNSLVVFSKGTVPIGFVAAPGVTIAP